jgi:uncharacterized protein
MTPSNYIAFCGDHCVAQGDMREVARGLKLAADAGTEAPLLVFNAASSEPAEIDLRGSLDDVLARLPPPPPEPATESAPDQPGEDPRRGPGRPKLGVVAREVTLLPRHWDWLAAQPGGASVALRKLVEDARKALAAKDRARRAKDVTYRFAAAMAGNRPHYEEAMRALFAGDRDRFETLTQAWPAAIGDHARRLAAPAFDEAGASSSS